MSSGTIIHSDRLKVYIGEGILHMYLFRIANHNRLTHNNMQSTFPAHTHRYYEIYCFLSGDIMFSVEGNLYPLEPGDIMIFNKTETHHIILHGNAPYGRMCVHFSPTSDLDLDFGQTLLAPFKDRVFGMHNLYPARMSPDSKRMYYIEQICNTDDVIKKQVYLMVLLQELAEDFPKIQDSLIVPSKSSISNVTHYINTHITESLSTEHLCEQFYISKSQLHRNFKNVLGITVGEYILSKRLVLAQNLIQKGKRPTSIYLECGFQDYSGFFKAYKKKFGHAPSEEIDIVNEKMLSGQITD